ncbi:MAG: CHASE4 domain-containing protein, partial [Fibrobacterota bacterium]
MAQPALLLAVLAVVACVVGVDQIQSGFRQLEEDELVRARARARRVLDKHFASEMLRARDWAEWDDAANWLDGRNSGFPESNLTDSTLSVLEEDHLVYWNRGLAVLGSLSRDSAGK